MPSKSNFCAVLMGDLVGSERHADQADLHDRFNAAIDRQNAVRAANISSPLTITLGDEFQGLFDSTWVAASTARDIRYELLAQDIDCRFVIGLVDVRTPVNRDRAWNMLGPGFAAARELLGEKQEANRYRFSVLGDDVLEALLNASGASLTAIEQGWTRIQREVIAILVRGATVAEVAQARKVSIHTIYKVRSAGQFEVYTKLWNAVHKAMIRLDDRHGLPGSGHCGTKMSV